MPDGGAARQTIGVGARAVGTPDRPAGGARPLVSEVRGVSPVPPEERHGRAWSQFTLWFGSNLTIADLALGFLPVSLGVPWRDTIAALVVGNLLGSLAVGACATLGPPSGLPQLVLGRRVFGQAGGALPAALNYLSTLGWYVVNTILGAFAVRVLAPAVPFFAAATGLVVVQTVLAVFGHDLIHAFERAAAALLGLAFLVATGVVLSHAGRLAALPASHGGTWGAAGIVFAAAFSYVASWAPYAADYSRYLPVETSPRAVLAGAAGGNFVASLWLELLGAGVAVLAGSSTNPIAGLHRALGAFGGLATVAVAIGAVAANALNGYSNGLAAGALGLPIGRRSLVGAAAVLGLAAALVGAGGFEARYEDFLLSLGYWVTPWLGVVTVHAWHRSRRGPGGVPGGATQDRRVDVALVATFVLAGVASIPFMDGPYYEGPVARLLGGADLSYVVAYALAAVATGLILARRDQGRHAAAQPVERAPQPVERAGSRPARWEGSTS